jgi:tRNA (guanine37-N1)-methyltransferase
MIGFKVPFKNAEKAKIGLISEGLLDKGHKIEKTGSEIIFPVLKEKKASEKRYNGMHIVHDFIPSDEKKDYKAYLKDTLGDEELRKLPVAYDVVGDIIIIDLKDCSYEKEIGKALLLSNKSIKVILKKKGIHMGEFRTQPLLYVAGERRKEATYKENNTVLKLDVEKVYFSPRLSTERKRIFLQVHKGEDILVMFSGCAPYPVTLSKNTCARYILGIEKNPVAHRYAEKNISLNKTKNIELINGDVREVVPKLKKKFDRILMPLPKGAEDFLDLAFLASKPGATVHFYDFEHESELDSGEKKVLLAAIKYNKKVKIIRTVKCGQYSPGKYRICVDFVIE